MTKWALRRSAKYLAKARALRGWTQEQAAEAVAPYLGAKLSGASFSALERSAFNVNRIKQFSADELLALSRGFDLPIGLFFTPPPPAVDAGLHAPDAGPKGLDPIVLLDAILGTPENLALGDRAPRLPGQPRTHAQEQAGEADVSPKDLADRLEPQGAMRGRALLRQAFGEVDDASEVLERLAEALRVLDETARDGTSDEAAPDGTGAGESGVHAGDHDARPSAKPRRRPARM